MTHQRIALLLALACIAACHRGPKASVLSPGDIWIRDVTVVSTERSAPLQHAHVVIRGRDIVSVDVVPPGDAPAGVTAIDGAGKYLTAGLIDGHVHLAGVPGMSDAQEQARPELVAAYDRQLPRSYLYFGFTAVVDLNVVDRPRFERLRMADIGPAIFDCGNGLSLANGYPMAYLPPAERFDRYPNFLYDPAQAKSIPAKYAAADHSPEADVARAAAGGAICIKAFDERGFGELANKLPVPTPEMMRAVREASHRHGLPLLLHANALYSHRFAAETGVDAVVHGMWNQDGAAASELSADVRRVLDAEQKAGVGMMPTSRVISGLADLFLPAFLNDPHLPRVLPAAVLSWYRTDEAGWFKSQMSSGGLPANARDILLGIQKDGLRAAAYFVRHGGRLLFGSDTPSAPTYANPPGYNGYLELRELEEGGLTPRQLLTAATLENARFFKLTNYGTVEAGKIASLLLLRENPLASTTAFDSIETVIVAGRVASRASLAANQ
jgi:imidazolonepropionase-like amidohydrolase